MSDITPAASSGQPRTPMETRNTSHEAQFHPLSGYGMLALVLLLPIACVTALVWSANLPGNQAPEPAVVALAIPTLVLWVFLLPGFFIVEPNLGRALVLFGRYRGTVRTPGFYWTNPFTSKKKISLRAHNLNGKTLKVNDLLGNPIEIAAIVVWQVRDTAQALFDVEDYLTFVDTQSESALRMVASRHPYDDGQATEVDTTLRGSADEVSVELQRELQVRLQIAGIEVIEARLSHLAYAPEIAAAMLQRQQATAIIAARKLIVDGAVGMVEMAIEKLGAHKVVELDDERKATLTGNLLVVLCGQQNAQPVLNTGGLYN
ncbi:MAG: SPFH domain-containing protein [Planctomycetes bacterium]|nr:SPFH domain-containing protein [Planctomycetota bacterium]